MNILRALFTILVLSHLPSAGAAEMNKTNKSVEKKQKVRSPDSRRNSIIYSKQCEYDLPGQGTMSCTLEEKKPVGSSCDCYIDNSLYIGTVVEPQE